MPVQLQVNDVLAVRAWCKLGTQASVNTYNFEVISSAGAGATDQDVANGMDGFMSTFYETILANNAVYRGVQVYFIKRTGPLLQPVSSITGQTPGTGGAKALPLNTALILKYSTVVRGPSGRGRVFLPFLSASAMEADGHPTVAVTNFVDAFGNSLTSTTIIGTPPNTATLAWVLVAKNPVVTTGQIVNVGTANKFGQMHKRGDYGKPNDSPI